jgi:hypothetical protein
MTRGTLINDVIEVVREASDLKKEIRNIEKDMKYIIGYHVSYIETDGNKKVFHECVVNDWNGEGWDLMSTDDPDMYFAITFKDIIDGNVIF